MSEFHRRTALSAFGLAGLAAAGATGPLNPPPGSVASTGKPIAEAEPRTAVNATNTPAGNGFIYRINQPGSYYLTGNITLPAGQSGIFISVSDVTIDLNGFAILGAAGTGGGISVNTGTNNLSIFGGAVRNCTGNGIDASATNYVRIAGVTVSGCTNYGIITGDQAHVADCIVNTCGSGAVGGGGGLSVGDGISVGMGSIVRSCAVRTAGTNGISARTGYAVITDCYVSDASNTGSCGVFALQRAIIRGCQVSTCTVGIRANTISRVEACHVNNCTQYGILCDAGGATKVINNDVVSIGSTTGHAGIRIGLGVTGCSVEGNRLESNYRHIDVASAAHLIVRNTMAYAGVGGIWSMAANNSYGPLVVVGGVGDISGAAQSNHPQANLAY